MTTKQLEQKFTGSRQTGYGHFKIGFLYRGKEITTTTTDTMALDKINSDDDRREPGRFYVTKKQALLALYDEVIRANY